MRGTTCKKCGVGRMRGPHYVAADSWGNPKMPYGSVDFLRYRCECCGCEEFTPPKDREPPPSPAARNWP